MLITVQNLTDSVLSTDVGSIEPRQSRSQSVSPEMGYKISESLKLLSDAGRCLVTISYDEPSRLNSLEPAQATNETQDTISLYVDVNGSDANPGTQASPLRTIQAAVNKVPKTIRHPVNINVGVGSFAGAFIDSFVFSTPASTTVGSWFRIKGTMVRASLDGMMTGQVTSATKGVAATPTFGTVTVTGAGWTVNQLRGKVLRILTGPGSESTMELLTNPVIIHSNTADTITVCAVFENVPTSASTFEIQDWGTVLTGGISRPLSGEYVPVSTTDYAFYLHSVGESFHTSSGSIKLESMRFDGTRAANVRVACSWSMDVCSFTNPASTQIFANTLSSGYIARFACMLDSGDNFSFVSVSSNFASLVRGFVYSPSNNGSVGTVATGGELVLTQVAGVGLGSFVAMTAFAKSLSAYNSRSESCTTGIALGTASANTYVNLSRTNISNATTAINVARGAVVTLSEIGGTGNTTAISAVNGANVYIKSDCTLTGTTELSVDGSAFTLAAMRAATPKYCTNATIAITGTKVYGD